MTEQPPSAEALKAVAEHIRGVTWEHMCLSDELALLLDRFAEQRVAAETERCAKIAEEAADYVSAGKPLVVIPARTFASDLALDIRDAIRAQGKQS